MTHVTELIYLRNWLRKRTPLDDPGLLALDWAIRELGGPLPSIDDVTGILRPSTRPPSPADRNEE